MFPIIVIIFSSVHDAYAYTLIPSKVPRNQKLPTNKLGICCRVSVAELLAKCPIHEGCGSLMRVFVATNRDREAITYWYIIHRIIQDS